MKKTTCLLTLMLLMTTAAFTQNLSKAEDAPSWFFNPSAGEYAGVSLPLKNAELARQQAIYAALLSYVAQNEVQIHTTGIIAYYSNDENHIIKGRDECTFTLPDKYEVVKTAVNRYGEVFVSLKVAKAAGKGNIEVFARQYFSGVEEDELTEDINQLEFLIKDSLPNAALTFSGMAITQDEDTDIVMLLRQNTPNSSVQEQFIPEIRYSYSPSSTTGMVARTNGETYILPSWSSHSLHNSLGAAYVSALLSGIMEDCVAISLTMESSVKMQTLDDEYHSALFSNFSENTVTKPAKVIIEKKIDTEKLYLITKEK